jgi:NAD(P)-dependent dehydrogenase (short-subunit alcohol dehydrogenase family)
MKRLAKKKILITQSQDYMGPAIAELFLAEGAQVVSKSELVPFKGGLEDYASDCNDIDVII